MIVWGCGFLEITDRLSNGKGKCLVSQDFRGMSECLRRKSLHVRIRNMEVAYAN